MVIPDVNVLLYAYDSDSLRHAPCAAWLSGVLSGAEEVGLSFVVALGFIRLVTHPAVWARPMPTTDAIAIVRSWLARPQVRLLQPTDPYWETLEAIVTDARAVGPLVMDAHLAAMAKEHGATVVTTDRDFRRFTGVRSFDPSV